MFRISSSSKLPYSDNRSVISDASDTICFKISSSNPGISRSPFSSSRKLFSVSRFSIPRLKILLSAIISFFFWFSVRLSYLYTSAVSFPMATSVSYRPLPARMTFFSSTTIGRICPNISTLRRNSFNCCSVCILTFFSGFLRSASFIVITSMLASSCDLLEVRPTYDI